MAQAEDRQIYQGQRKLITLRLRDALLDPWDLTDKQIHIKLPATLATTGTKFLIGTISGDGLIGRAIFQFDDADTILLPEGELYIDVYVGTGFNPANGTVSTSRALTGTLSFTSGGTAVTGSGTAFLTELTAGMFIKKGSGTGDAYTEILSVTDDTNLVLASNYPGTTGAGSAGLSPVKVEIEQEWKTAAYEVISPYNGVVD